MSKPEQANVVPTEPPPPPPDKTTEWLGPGWPLRLAKAAGWAIGGLAVAGGIAYMAVRIFLR